MNLVWFRSDLRVTDNSALWNAYNRGETVSCCLLPIAQWQSYGLGQRKIDFIRGCAEELQQNLKELGIPLQIREVGSFDDQINELLKICQQQNIESLFWNNEYPLDERNRDMDLCEQLASRGIEYHRSDDALILPPGSVQTQQGENYKVFTPFRRTWASKVEGQPVDLITVNNFKPEKRTTGEGQINPGEAAAIQSLEAFIGREVDHYQAERDFPAQPSTSSLSAHLSAGSISPRTCLKLAVEANNYELSTGSEGTTTWVSQIIWREFYYHLIASDDRLSKSKPFKAETDHIRWNDPTDGFESWKQGLTGIPIVDAGMRQLNTTGWMHNRVRMITAMYLTKNLLIDWRLGEQYFLEQLVDADFALNNGGWQWSASTGTDAVPYFRVFNPFNQAKRFDPDASYIKHFVAELKDLPVETLHNEAKLAANKPGNYPAPTISIKASRARAIEAFKSLKTSQIQDIL